MIEVSRKALVARQNCTTVGIAEVKRAIMFLSSWQRAALPALAASASAGSTAVSPAASGAPALPRVRRGSVRRPRKRRVVAGGEMSGAAVTGEMG
jgi:hypothetical protein